MSGSNYALAVLKRVLAFPLLVGTASAEGITVYLSPNDAESAENSGILGATPEQVFTESFNAVPTGTLLDYFSPDIQVDYTSGAGGQIYPNDVNGGFDQGNYLGIDAGSQVTLNLNNPSQYFGIYVTAAEPFSGIDIYNGDDLMLQFSLSTLLSLIPNDGQSVVTALNGATYLTDDYYGQPATGDNIGQPYAYLHFTTDGTDVFDRIVLHHSDSQIFESDNHSILADLPVIPQSFVLVPEAAAPAPEPSTALLLGGMGLFLLRRKR
ncbi:MAG TPA: PEP-CTERM sorting domain-containing protein [Verrucomicrobiales bacterium]|jgi:hypothetical protein|nr:PEP-CTERM sorting domain-containing protein [Verrucomicrobiales bacterium]